MLKVVIVGSGGRLGSALMRGYADEAELVGFNHAQLDLASNEALRATLEPLDYDVLVNCAALTNVDYCETHSDEAFAINATAVRQMAEISSRKQARCIHISTDYVFDGEQRHPYTETDSPAPLSVYGESKRQGEVELLGISEKHLAVRVSWVFGPDRPSFVDQVLKRALAGDPLEAIGDKWSTPTYSLDAVDLLRPLLAKDCAGGLLHLTQTGACTWQEYGQYALDCAASLGIPLKTTTVGFQALGELKAFVAKRPVYTVLGTNRLTELTGATPRSWQCAVSEYVERFYRTQA